MHVYASNLSVTFTLHLYIFILIFFVTLLYLHFTAE